ncbi:hypothetical protein P8452_40165 [Trifolium repens]|nr:hypothetical protein P8452_40165 [Trifolium repens]
MALFHFLILGLCIACCNVDARSKTQLNEQNSTMLQVDNDFDCVDIYKQYALQHPLLKNHKIQLYPTFARNVVRSRLSYNGACPGKVPTYNRIRKHQIVTNSSSKLQLEDFSSRRYHTVSLDTTQNCVYGGYAVISIYNLPLSLGQSSSSLICVESGPPNELNEICAGLTLTLYGDSQPRLTTEWKALGSNNIGCIDKDCPGFVQV